jgi:hypothetical protein
MLASYALIQTSDANEIEAAWIQNSRGNGVDMSGAGAASELVANLAPFDDANLTYCRYQSPIAVSFDAADYTRLIYQMREGSTIVIEGESSEFGSSRAGCLIPAGRRWRSRYAGELENLAVRIPTATLQRKLSAYLGTEREVLDLLQPSAADPSGAEALRQAIFGLSKAVDRSESKFLPNLIVSSLDELGLRLFACFSQGPLPLHPPWSSVGWNSIWSNTTRSRPPWRRWQTSPGSARATSSGISG